MDKFLNVCFKIGKYVLFMLIILCFLCIIGSAILIPQTFKKIEVENPTFLRIFTETQSARSINNNTLPEPYVTEFHNVAHNFTDYGKEILWNKVQTIDYKYRVQYLQTIDKVLNDLYEYGNKNKIANSKYQKLFGEIVMGYDSDFRANILKKELSETQQKIERYTAFASIISSILLFILFLTIALLIKIEENTRK